MVTDTAKRKTQDFVPDSQKMNRVRPATNALFVALFVVLAAMAIIPVIFVFVVSISSETSIREVGYSFFPIMAAIRYDVDPLLKKIQEMLQSLPPVRRFEAEPAPQVEVETMENTQVQITRHDNVFMVEGKWLLQLINSVNFDDYESLQYFQRVLIQTGVIDALREAGCEEGDTVSMYDLEFDFVE